MKILRTNLTYWRRILILLILVLSFSSASARTDLSIAVTDITFSKDNALEGERVRVFARVFNLGDTDVYGFVLFTDKGKEMADPQPISVKTNSYDDVFVDWPAAPGTHNIQARIIQTNLPDDNPGNDTAVKENYFVDLDTDGDGIGNMDDLDDDGDGISDEEEAQLGTDSLEPDSDGDAARDGVDAFPLDSAEWQDTDQDGLGNNADSDDDGDGLPDEEEIFVLGTNPLNPDTDQDGLSDWEEISFGTSLLEKDSDGDGVIDSEDDFPLDVSRSQASVLESLFLFIESKGISPIYFWGGAVLFLFLIFLFFRRRR